MNGMAASDKIFRILDIPEPKAGEKTLPDGGLDISFRDVHFSYEKDREILEGLTFMFLREALFPWLESPAVVRVPLRESSPERTGSFPVISVSEELPSGTFAKMT